MTASQTVASGAPQVSVIIPARNEEANLGSCLESLVRQQSLPFEIIVVNDHSTDRTGEIAESFAGVRVIDAGLLPAGWTGKNNAVATGAKAARAPWLLFTDADTEHRPGSLGRAVEEAQRHGADLLSYSPEQVTATFWEMAVLPVVFAELARAYPPSRVSDPNSPHAAANGQYLLISRQAYDAVGGHAAVAHDILEDVALARNVKASGRRVRFRYGGDAVRTRMYRSFTQLREGWTKNLVLLFPYPGWLAATSLGLWALVWIVAMLVSALGANRWWYVLSLVCFVGLWMRVRRSNFGWDRSALGALFGMPMFAYLLLRSRRAYARGHVSWKGRTYDGKNQPSPDQSQENSIPSGKLA